MKIGIVREGKNPPDKRVPFTPEQCKFLQETGHVEMVVQPSEVRAFTDTEYQEAGISVSENVSDCDVLMGVKEVNVDDLISDKQYLFFSHVIKKQPYNRKLMQAMVKKNITMTDYECLRDSDGERVVGFGKYAGIVGAYNGILGWGLRNDSFKIKRAHECFDYAELKQELKKVALPPVKIILTGTGRVGQGALEIMEELKIKKAGAEEFINEVFNEPVYCIINYDEYYKNKSGKPFDKSEFRANPGEFETNFLRFTNVADIFISCHYWENSSPRLFSEEDMKKQDFNIKLIADITCDIKGSVPSTIRPSTVADPFYGYDPQSDSETEAFSHKAITVMAIDNLPCELPRDASAFFGNELITKVMPLFWGEDPQHILERGTILKHGKLTPPFQYLEDYASLDE